MAISATYPRPLSTPHPCFNDDVQGTGCVTLAAIMAGLHVSKTKLADLRLVVFGAGTAGCGIADQVREAIAAERGISAEEAAKQIWCVSLTAAAKAVDGSAHSNATKQARRQARSAD